MLKTLLLLVLAILIVYLLRGIGLARASKKRSRGIDRTQIVDAEFREVEHNERIEE